MRKEPLSFRVNFGTYVPTHYWGIESFYPPGARDGTELMGQVEKEAKELMRNAGEDNVESPYWTYQSIAYHYAMASGEYDKALSAYEIANTYSSGSVLCVFETGMTYLHAALTMDENCYLGEAEIRFQECIEGGCIGLDFEDQNAHYFLACCHLYQGEVNDGIQALQESLLHHPDWLEAYHALARTLAATGDCEKAIAICQQGINVAMASNPDLVESELRELKADYRELKSQ